jgi:Ras-related GTP-binding protein A/B
MIPNVAQLEAQLNEFCEICGADEVVLFEKATFLEISHTSTLK